MKKNPDKIENMRFFFQKFEKRLDVCEATSEIGKKFAE